MKAASRLVTTGVARVRTRSNAALAGAGAYAGTIRNSHLPRQSAFTRSHRATRTIRYWKRIEVGGMQWGRSQSFRRAGTPESRSPVSGFAPSVVFPRMRANCGRENLHPTSGHAEVSAR